MESRIASTFLAPLLLLAACASATPAPQDGAGAVPVSDGGGVAAPTPDAGGAGGTTTPVPANAPTVAATKGSFTVVLDLKGTFDAVDPAEIQYQPLVFGDELEIVEAAAPGPVEKGRVMARFKTEKIDEQIRNAELALALSKLGLDRQADEFSRLETSNALQLARVVKESADADLSLKTYEEIEKPLQIAEWTLSLQYGEDWLQDQTEEYAQLEKMYKGDDLTEETEEIVMRRAKRGLERSKTSMDLQKKWYALMMDIEMPRRHEGLKFAQRGAALEKERALAGSKSSLEQAKVQLDQARFALELQAQQFERLRKDRAGLVLTAPSDGLAVPGGLLRGRWTDLENMTRELRPGRKVRGNQPLWTIVRPGAVRVLVNVPEASLFEMKEGLQAKVTPAAAPGAKLAARVSRVSRVSAGNEFEAVLDLDEGDPRLLPGNSCSVKVTGAAKPNAITLPSGCVVEEGEKRFVHLSLPEGKAEKREVTVGAASGGRTEILTGVAEGTTVLQNPPK